MEGHRKEASRYYFGTPKLRTRKTNGRQLEERRHKSCPHNTKDASATMDGEEKG